MLSSRLSFKDLFFINKNISAVFCVQTSLLDTFCRYYFFSLFCVWGETATSNWYSFCYSICFHFLASCCLQRIFTTKLFYTMLQVGMVFDAHTPSKCCSICLSFLACHCLQRVLTTKFIWHNVSSRSDVLHSRENVTAFFTLSWLLAICKGCLQLDYAIQCFGTNTVVHSFETKCEPAHDGNLNTGILSPMRYTDYVSDFARFQSTYSSACW